MIRVTAHQAHTTIAVIIIIMWVAILILGVSLLTGCTIDKAHRNIGDDGVMHVIGINCDSLRVKLDVEKEDLHKTENRELRTP